MTKDCTAQLNGLAPVGQWATMVSGSPSELTRTIILGSYDSEFVRISPHTLHSAGARCEPLHRSAQNKNKTKFKPSGLRNFR
eukprot:2752648-Pleurochrysis_carterae.AAC.1